AASDPVGAPCSRCGQPPAAVPDREHTESAVVYGNHHVAWRVRFQRRVACQPGRIQPPPPGSEAGKCGKAGSFIASAAGTDDSSSDVGRYVTHGNGPG